MILPAKRAAEGDPFMGRQLRRPFATAAELLDHHAHHHPEKEALFDIDQNKGISFHALRDNVIRLSSVLTALGVRRGKPVILLGDETLEKLMVWLAIWRAGGCVCALNIETNAPHLRTIIDCLGADLVLCDESLRHQSVIGALTTKTFSFGTCNAPLIQSGDLFSLATNTNTEPPPELTAPTDLASIFCTSGTTGLPKIVFADHVSMWLCGLEATSAMGLCSEDRTLEYRAFSWTSTQSMSLMPWIQNGSTLNIAAKFSTSRFFDWVRNRDITFAVGVPTAVNMLLERADRTHVGKFPSLKRMSCSTAPLSTAQWERFESFYGIPLIQYFGMSEAGFVTANRHNRRRIGTVGLPAEYQDLKILDSAGNPCPNNVEGEITVSGPETTLGVMTLDGAYERIRGKRLRTGDLGVMDDEGFIRITGRLKDVIIRGGVNISPIEIDQYLCTHHQIAEAATIGVPDRIYGEEVVAFVVPRIGAKISEPDILAFCTAKFAVGKAPKRIFVVDALPRSDRGKIRRDELKEKWITMSASAHMPPDRPHE
jgi:acyl-CoA synthetase (AMP-forming)/AMP-acid ligase II